MPHGFLAIALSFLTVASCGGSARNMPVGSGGEPFSGGMEPDFTDPTVAHLPPLPTTTFVFVKNVKRGMPVTWRHHLYAFDMSTRQERLLSSLDDDGVNGTGVTGLALSPDRRWIAFSSDHFRSENADPLTRSGGSVWLVSVDGRIFRRLTPAFEPDPACAAQAVCRELFQSQPRNPTFSPKGSTVFYDHSYLRWDASGQVTHDDWLAHVPTTGGGEPVRLRAPSGCDSASAPSIHPGGRFLVAVQSCTAGLGLYELNLSPISLGRQLYRGRLNSLPAAWTSDGNQAFFSVVDESRRYPEVQSGG